MTTTDDSPRQFTRLAYSLTECADMLGISSYTVRRMVKRGELPAITVSKRPMIPASALYDFVQRASA